MSLSWLKNVDSYLCTLGCLCFYSEPYLVHCKTAKMECLGNVSQEFHRRCLKGPKYVYDIPRAFQNMSHQTVSGCKIF